MIDFEQAKQIALAHIGPDCGLLEEYTLEKPYGWYFSYQSREFIQTEDPMYFLYGGTHFIVERDGGRIVTLGSTYPAEEYIAAYEKGFKYERYDLTITAVRNREMTLRLLYSLGMGYVVVDVASGWGWQEHKRYSQIVLDSLLRRPPCVFRNVRFGIGSVKTFDRMDASGCCTYVLCEHKPRRPPEG